MKIQEKILVFGEPRSNNDIDKGHRLSFEAVLRAGLEVGVEITANPAQAQGHRGDKGRTCDKRQGTGDKGQTGDKGPTGAK